MKNLGIGGILAFLLVSALAAPSFGQQKVFNWLPANDETVRLDPANYHTGRTYHPGPNGGNIHVDIKAQQPITIFLTRAEEWNEALQHPENIVRISQLCLREHVVETTFLCDLPPEPMTLIVRDDRNSLDPVVFAGLGAVLDPSNKVDRAVGAGVVAVLTSRGPVTRHFVSPNDVHIQYYRWDCVAHCIQPEFQWILQVKEKYELTSFLKVYGGFVPDHDGGPVSIRIKSPVPMVVAMLPSPAADQLHSKPEELEAALEKNSCQQRGVQSLQFQCTFNLADGPQSLVVVPESGANIPHHKKAEIEFQAVKCVANCELLVAKQQ
jgi:hypothetical protein